MFFERGDMKFMEIIIEIYMYLRDGIKEYFILKKVRKNLKK